MLHRRKKQNLRVPTASMTLLGLLIIGVYAGIFVLEFEVILPAIWKAIGA